MHNHFSADLKGHRLFLSALGNHIVELLDVQNEKRLHTIPDLDEPQGLLYDHCRSACLLPVQRMVQRKCSTPPHNKNALWYSAHSLLLMGDLDEASERLTAALAEYPEEPLFISMRGMLHARRRQPDASLDCVRKALEYPVSFGPALHTYVSGS